jgi:hypothetical protein
MENKFIDMSIFEGIVNYIDELGNTWNREDKDYTYEFFKLDDNCYIHQGSLIKKTIKSKGIAYIHEAFLRS